MDTKKFDFAEALNRIAVLGLMFATRTDMAKHIEYNSFATNSAEKMKPFHQKAFFRELDYELKQTSYNKYDLQEIIEDYQKTAIFFDDNFSAWNVIDCLSGDVDKIQQVYDLLDYIVSGKITGSSKMRDIQEKLDKDYSINPSILFLLQIGIWSLYNANSKSVKTLDYSDFEKFKNILYGYADYANIIEAAKNAPVILRFENNILQTYKKEKYVSRLVLLDLVDSFLGVMRAYSSFDNVDKLNRKFDIRKYEDLEGFWKDDVTSNYYKFQYINDKLFVLYYYDRKFKTFTQYEGCFYYEGDYDTKRKMHLVHPSKIRNLIENEGRSDGSTEIWLEAMFKRNENSIQQIVLTPIIKSINCKFFNINKLIVCPEAAVFQKEFDSYSNAFPDSEYEYYCYKPIITETDIFIDIEELFEENENSYHYIKIPKKLSGLGNKRNINEALKNIQISDNFGLMKFQNKVYFAIPDLLFYIEITELDQMKKLGISFCNIAN